MQTPDIIARTEAFRRIRRLSGMRRAEIAAVTGLTVGSVRIYSAPSAPGKAPTWTAIEALRQEAIKRARKAVQIAEDTLFRCEIELQRLERMDIAETFLVEGKSSLETAVAIADRCRVAAQAARGSALPAPAPAACNRLSPTPVSGQI